MGNEEGRRTCLPSLAWLWRPDSVHMRQGTCSRTIPVSNIFIFSTLVMKPFIATSLLSIISEVKTARTLANYCGKLLAVDFVLNDTIWEALWNQCQMRIAIDPFDLHPILLSLSQTYVIVSQCLHPGLFLHQF